MQLKSKIKFSKVPKDHNKSGNRFSKNCKAKADEVRGYDIGPQAKETTQWIDSKHHGVPIHSQTIKKERGNWVPQSKHKDPPTHPALTIA